MEIDHVESTVEVEETSVRVRFAAVDSKADKSPVYRAFILLTGPFKGGELEAPIFANRDKKGAIEGYTVSIPGGARFAALKPAPKFMEDKQGNRYPIAGAADPDGAVLMQNWEPRIKEALYAFLQTGIAEQYVSFQ